MTLLSALAESAVRTIAFAGTVGLALVVLRVTRPGVRLYAWTVVLYGSLALFMLGWAMPGLQVPLPVMALSPDVSSRAVPAPFVDDAVARVRSEAAPSIERPAPEAPRVAAGAAVEATHRPRLSWSVVALSIYLAGVAVLLLHAGVGWVLTRRLERSVRLIDDEATLTRAAGHAAASGLPCAPRLAESDRLFIPVATSVLRPMIVLPGNWRAWTAATLDAVLAHEIAHVARRDAFTQRLSLLYRAVSWFNPVSWWLHRHLGDLAEQVSDEAALGAGVEPTFYAEALLGFLAHHMSGPPRRADWHVAMVHGASAAEQRVERILAWDGRRSRTLTRSFVLGVALAAAPTVLLAAAVRPEVVNLRVMDLPVVAAPGLGQPAGPRLLAMPAATSVPTSDRAQILTPAPVASSASPTQASVRPAPTAPIDASQGPLPNASFGGHRMFVVLFDLSSMTAAETQRAVNAARKWTDETMSITDLVALASIGTTVQVVRDFTNDKAKIQAALDDFAKGVPKTDAQGSNDVRVRGLKTICDDLLPIQEHKAILYFSSGMQRFDADQADQIELRAAVASCERANTSINPVDARGLPGGTPTTAVPDFSGKWTLDASPDIRTDAPLWSGGTIVQDASIVTFQAAPPTAATAVLGPPSGQLSYRFDGPSQQVVGGGQLIVSETKWTASALVITMTYHTVYGQWVDSVTLSFDAAGNLSVVTDRTPKQADVPRIVRQYIYKKS